ncbi:hypothetical protein FHG66_03910 [Rubellimicrobium rubrum]|uniref:Glycosyltransferase family 4 protein n=1 Tax=Rubellimicrobium rubrum TaxID=2585369 RepID=A0A5C4N6I5_9RHOB|nr:hypothetical protein [Rubellimicrobium rubrum]TNC51961.1 hypothetical protein FHG66_03910 [Rubellimicrobium rubrum]
MARGPRLDRRESRRRGRPVFLQRGSDIMRSQQLATLIQPHLPPHIDLSISIIPRIAFRWLTPWILAQPEAVFILLKNVAHAMSADQLDLLRKRAIAVGVDHIDGDPAAIDLGRFDVHVSASYAGLAALEQACQGLQAKAALLLHHADPRLDGLAFPTLPRVETVYLGYPPNLLLPASLAGEVEVLPVVTPDDMARAIPRLPDFNLHYGVRPPPPTDRTLRVYKPFTKGMTAAACSSNIIVNRDVDDAVAFLGEDYPYLVDDVEPDAIAAALDRAKGDLGTPRWTESLARMARIRALVSGPNLARQFTRILSLVT